MSLSQRTLKAGTWQLTAVVTRAALQLAVLAVLARYVSPSEFGYIAMANMVIIFVEMFAEAGIGPAVIQRSELRQDHLAAGFLMSVVLGTVFVLILWFCAPFLAAFFQTESLVGIIRTIGFSVLILKLSVVSRARIERDMRFDILMWVDIGSYVTGFALVGVAMAVQGYGVWAIIAGKLTQCAIQTVSLLVIRPLPMRPVFSSGPYKELLTYGSGLTLVRIFDNIASQGDYFIVARFLGSASLGFYERASSIMAMPGHYLSYAMDKSLFPAMSQVQTETQRLENAYFMATNIVCLLLVPFSVLMILIAPELIPALLGPNWPEAVLPFQILSMTVVFRIFMYVTDTLVRATGAVYASAARRAVYAGIILASCWIGTAGGLTGVAVAMNLSVMAGYLLMVHLGMKIVRFRLLDYLDVLKNGFLLGGILLAVLWPFVTVLRLYISHPVLFLGLTLVFSGLILVAALFSAPSLLGKTGHAFVSHVVHLMHLEKYAQRLADLKN